MQFNKSMAAFLLTLSAFTIPHTSFSASHQPKHFSKIMVVIFENMSYEEIKNEPTFRKLVEYSGNTLDSKGRLIKLLKAGPTHDTTGNGYALYSSYFNNHSGGTFASRPSQPNYIAMTSGSTHGIISNDIHNLNVDNLGLELNEANISWKVYAEDLPDPKDPVSANAADIDTSARITKPFMPDPHKSEQENDRAEQKYNASLKKAAASINGFLSNSGCFTGESNVEGQGAPDDGYMRKHEPFISYTSIQNKHENCAKIINASHLAQDVNNLPDVTFYIPNQIHDGHNGELEERVINANSFLSKMMGTNPKTGEPLPDAANAPFQKFMAQDGMLVITFDEPSVTGNPDRTIYTLLAGNMLNSGAYPGRNGDKSPVCYPSAVSQTGVQDSNGLYEPSHCNHYNLLKLIEENWSLRGLKPQNTSAGYKHAFALDNGIDALWKQ
jgi:hypothetical protein